MKEGQTQEPCNRNCGMNYCDEYGCIENKPEGDVSHLLTPPPSLDVEAFSKKVIDSLQKFYELGDETGYSNSELSRIRSCINKVKEIKAGYAPPSPVGIDVEALRKLFDNNFDCYTSYTKFDNSTVDDVPAMTKKKFIEVLAGYAASLPQSSTGEECQHPFAFVQTRCMGEINHCLKCGKNL